MIHRMRKVTQRGVSGVQQESGGRARPPIAWRWYLPLLLTVTTGVVVTLVVFAAFRGSEAGKLKADFQSMAADRAQAIRAGLSEDFVELDLLSSYVTASRELAEDLVGSFASEFGNFVRRIPSQEPIRRRSRSLPVFLHSRAQASSAQGHAS